MRRLLIGLAAGALFVTATACGSSGPGGGDAGSGGTTTLKLGVIPIIDVAPLYLGEKKGFYSKRGLELEPTLAQGGAAIVPGVVSGQFDFGFSNMTSLLVAQSKNVPVKAVVNGVASTGKAGADFAEIMVRKGSPLKTASDLEGKKVAANTLGNICDTSVNESVRKDGGDPSEVEYVEMPFDQMPAALAKGQVDAACVVEPALAAIKSQGGTVLASNFVDVSPYLTVAMYFTSQKYAAENPETVKKFQEATAESLAYADAHPDEVRQIITTYTKIPRNLLETVVLPHWPAEPDRASIERLGELGQKDGLFEKTPDLDELLP
ncbi:MULTISPECIES: ABC transporter substrate-binding protein [Streptomyces]|uniref:NitT/TauT family transport system substrate-binding protein n=1 Tax=Streptomyces stelliscabiei TaxID=146820 RepID=A0A8I0PF45_9ACTN|nr:MULTISPECIES: ABC transporter substrate-binding protein [Streptomyces]KND44740.1 nitrate ABC transporter substrate-binding protein [Streptomyces stelliscabiei]MBE1601514.1 NitT/TauT family transport system substrate-binding protein [Streptomyces stelliscabiei]MDX2515165.1 ABC transporter substrate-binding protein [Streptomyces stelliscabiei]MDX2555278.1 ABC transporter substrate-binding protein [Streptomyces stelliscabiei]MDX2612967.1 ABC transporter substrate-binding protein [Streptomyces 